MSKGSGRRRTTPADGIIYNAELDITNIEQRGSRAIESIYWRWKYSDPGAPPTCALGGGKGRRWAGKGRKNDNRNWKSYTRGKQYAHNL